MQGVFEGDRILAPEDLTNVITGYSETNGNYLIGTTRDGLRKYAFLHMKERPAAGDRFEGSLVGLVGNTGYVIGGNVHLHLSVITKDSEVSRLGIGKSISAGGGWSYVSFKTISQFYF